MTATMHRFTVLAASMMDGTRISRTLEAWSDLHARSASPMRLASRELWDWHYYVVSIEEVKPAP